MSCLAVLAGAWLAIAAPSEAALTDCQPRCSSREQVLHVARLARLELTEEEVGRLAEELSKVLDHIETIGELDIADVEPTSHVVNVENALRGDEPAPVAAARGRARLRARRRRRRLPRAEPGPGHRSTALTSWS